MVRLVRDLEKSVMLVGKQVINYFQQFRFIDRCCINCQVTPGCKCRAPVGGKSVCTCDLDNGYVGDAVKGKCIKDCTHNYFLNDTGQCEQCSVSCNGCFGPGPTRCNNCSNPGISPHNCSLMEDQFDLASP